MPAYSTDLQTLSTADGVDGSQPTGWSETSGHITGNQATADEDLVLQGQSCVSKPSGNATGVAAGFNYNHGINIRADADWVDGTSVIFYWWLATFPSALESFTFGPTTGVSGDTGATISGGYLLGVGQGEANARYFNVGGNDKYAGPFGGWVNTAVEPVNTPVAYTDGSPNAIYDVFHYIPVLKQSVRRGNSMAADVLRWGPRGKITVSGTGVATLDRVGEFDSRNDTSADSEFTLIDSGQHRLGLFQSEAGFYLWKGQLEVTGTLTDDNTSIVLQDCPTVYADFTEMLVNDGTVNLTNVSFTAQATSPRQGKFSRTGLSPTLNMTGCVLLDTSTASLSSATGCSFVRTLAVTTSGNFKNNKVTESADTVGLKTSSVNIFSNDVTGNEFTKSASTSHAAEISGTTDFVWDNTLIGYGTGSTGSPVTTTSTGNEALHLTSTSGTIDISVAAGATIPTIRSSGVTVNVIAQQTTLTITGVKAGSDVVIRSAGTTTKLLDVQDIVSDGSVSYQYTFAASTFVDVAVYGEGFVPFFINNFELSVNDASLPAAQVTDRNYTP